MRLLSYILVAALFALSTLLAMDLIRQTYADLLFHLGRGLPDLQRAQRLDPTRATIPREIAASWMDAFPPRLDRASSAYQAAATLEPEEGLHWIGLARANLRLGRIPQTMRALNVAEFVDPHNRVIQQELASLYMELEDEERTLDHHARAIALNPALMRTLGPYYLGLGLKPRAIAERLLGDNPRLLDDFFTSCLVGGIEPDDVSSLWAYLTTRPGTTPVRTIRAYFDYLLAHQEFPAARSLWGYVARTLYHHHWDPSSEPFWNADLKFDPLFPAGLEWQFADPFPDGCEAEITQVDSHGTSRSLALHFDGTKNLAFFHVRHPFFVEPGCRYTLRCHARAQGLTTDNGPYLVVILYAQPQQVAKSKVLTGSGSWDLVLDFTVPTDCIWAELQIRRDFSTRLNNKIKGDVCFDSFVLSPVSEPREGVRR